MIVKLMRVSVGCNRSGRAAMTPDEVVNTTCTPCLIFGAFHVSCYGIAARMMSVRLFDVRRQPDAQALLTHLL